MTCIMCKHGATHPGVVTVTLRRAETTVILKDVPAEVCENCGEYYLGEQVAQRAYSLAEAAVRSGAEIEIRRFAA